MNLYISFMYEPLVEEFDEAKYFTENFDSNFTKKCLLNRAGK